MSTLPVNTPKQYQIRCEDGRWRILDISTGKMLGRGRKTQHNNLPIWDPSQARAPRLNHALKHYDEVWNEELAQKVIAEFGEGASLIEVAQLIDISMKVFYNWLGTEGREHFTETIRRGLEASEAWWKRQGRINLFNKEFRDTLWIVNMRCRWGWNVSGTSGRATEREPIVHLDGGTETSEAQAAIEMVDTDDIIRRWTKSLEVKQTVEVDSARAVLEHLQRRGNAKDVEEN